MVIPTIPVSPPTVRYLPVSTISQPVYKINAGPVLNALSGLVALEGGGGARRGLSCVITRARPLPPVGGEAERISQ